MIYTYHHSFSKTDKIILIADLSENEIKVTASPYPPKYEKEYLKWRKWVSKDIQSKLNTVQLMNLYLKARNKESII